jgi:N-acetylmuramoyl-L-alanine amidase
MQQPYGDSDAADRPFWRFVGRNLALLAFLAVSAGAMFAVYTYFSGSSGVAEVVAAGGMEGARPVTQRLAQSPGPIHIGIISGHKGNDSGAVCADGLTEAEVVENIAARVIAGLQTHGIAADLLDEFDARLQGYVATGLVSIHADSCDYINDLATGFKIAGSGYTDSSQLSICIEDAYRQATQMNYHANTITPHMTDYHAFRELAAGVPGVIIEVGFLNLDRAILTTQPDVVAGAITDGILCYVDDVRGGVNYTSTAGPPAALQP